MKLLSIILSFAILLTGCYTNTPLTKDSTLNLGNEELTFYLIDETYITSDSGKHHRVEYGYKVVGKLYGHGYHRWDGYGERNWEDFDGIIGDMEIKEIAKSEYNEALSTAIIVGSIVAGVVGIVLIINSVHGHLFPSSLLSVN